MSSLYLDAFVAVAQSKNFSKAAARLNLTQSALSQRVLKLEAHLETTLFIRDRAGVLLTELGQELLRYCVSKTALEEEFISRLRANGKHELKGEIRIGGFSSVMRSVILPALAPLLRNNPGVRLSLISRQLRELPDLLRRGEINFMVLDHLLERDDLEKVDLGFEQNVLVQSAKAPPPNIYLDHDEDDQVTRRYLQLAGKNPGRLERRYLGDVYGLLDGVRQGLGRAVLPRHLIAGDSKISIVQPSVVLKIPVVLHYYTQPYYPLLQQGAVEALSKGAPQFLRG